MSLMLIIGESGSGKSTSLRNLNPKETLLINAKNKLLPFRGGTKKFKDVSIFTDNCKVIVSEIKKANKNNNIKAFVIDDFQELMSNLYMRKIFERGYDKYNEIGHDIWSITNAANECRHDLKVVLLAHSETDESGKIKCKTIGKLVDQKVSIEGSATVVLQSKVRDGKYIFLTQNDGTSIAKSPMGMFPDLEIDNDLNEVIKTMDSYLDGEEISVVNNNITYEDMQSAISKCNTLDELTETYKNLLFETHTELQGKELIDMCAARKNEIREILFEMRAKE